MKNNDWKNRLNIVYSTNSNFQYEEKKITKSLNTLLKEKQLLKIQLDKHLRDGKQVTLITGFIGRNEDLQSLGKLLKIKCGVGGSVKGNTIFIQGDFRTKIFEILQKEGYYKTKIMCGTLL